MFTNILIMDQGKLMKANDAKPIGAKTLTMVGGQPIHVDSQ
jgi:hypothetical protein